MERSGRRWSSAKPYRGVAPALTDLIGGQAQVMFPSLVSSLEFIRAGKLRVLAVTTATQSQALPNVPTLGEFVPGYEASFVYGLGAPKNTPTEVVEKLSQETNRGLADPKIKARFGDLGVQCFPARPPNSASSSRRRQRSGARWSSSRASSRSETAIPATYSITPVPRMRPDDRWGSKPVRLELSKSFPVCLRQRTLDGRDGAAKPSALLDGVRINPSEIGWFRTQ